MLIRWTFCSSISSCFWSHSDGHVCMLKQYVAFDRYATHCPCISFSKHKFNAFLVLVSVGVFVGFRSIVPWLCPSRYYHTPSPLSMKMLQPRYYLRLTSYLRQSSHRFRQCSGKLSRPLKGTIYRPWMTVRSELTARSQSEGRFPVLISTAHQLSRGLYHVASKLYIVAPLVPQGLPPLFCHRFEFCGILTIWIYDLGQRFYDKVCASSSPSGITFGLTLIISCRLTSFPLLLAIAWYERQSKRSNSTGFYETISAVAETVFDTLPRHLKRLSTLI